MNSAAFDLRRVLVSEGRLKESAKPPPEIENERPWFVSTILGFCGWLAGLFVVWLVAMLFEPRGAASWFVAGLISLGSAYALYWADKESAFFDQLALALSIAGQFGVGAAIADVTKGSAASIFAMTAILQMMVAVVMPNRFAKGLAAAFAVVAWSLSVRFGWWESGTFDLRMQVDLLPALLGWIVIWAPVAAIATILVERESAWMASGLRAHARPILIGLLLALSFGTVASQPIGALQVFMGEGSRANWLVIWPLLSVGAAAYAFFLAVRVRSRSIAGGAIVAMLMHMAHFYYLFGTTLRVKSVIMIALGALMLWVARSMIQSREVQS